MGDARKKWHLYSGAFRRQKSYIEILLLKQNFPHSSEAIPFDVCIAKGARWWVKMMVIGDCRESP